MIKTCLIALILTFKLFPVFALSEKEDGMFELEKNGRNYGNPTFSPNGEEILITESSRALNPDSESYVLRFNLKSKVLYRYNMPKGYAYSYANYSLSGKWIVLSRFPNSDGSEKSFREALEQGEIVMMHPDGKDFHVTPIPKGENVRAALSNDDSKIVYWRAGIVRSPGSKSILADFDIYEYDFLSGKNFLFAGQHKFFESGNLYYLTDESILVGAFGPKQYAFNMMDYLKKFNYSRVYQINRGERDLPIPSFTNIQNASHPSVDENKNFYLEGVVENQGQSFIKIADGQPIKAWVIPKILAISGIGPHNVSPQGDLIVFLYASKGTRLRENKLAIGILNLASGIWSPVNIPLLNSGKPIDVISKN